MNVRIVAALAVGLLLPLAAPATAQADIIPRKTCVDSVTTAFRGRVEITTTTRVCPGVYYVRVERTTPNGKTRVVVDTFPALAPRR